MNPRSRIVGGFWAQAGLLAGPFMSMIDSSVINVALPNIANSLHSSLAAVQWAASAYLLALGLGTTATAYLAKRYGTLPLYRLSLLGFTAMSGLCALAPSLGWLVGARVAQGLFGALLVPLAMNMLLGKKSAALGMSMWAGMILFLAPALGPAVGGMLIQWRGWPLVFIINIPVGILAYMGARRIPNAIAYQETTTVAFDSVGFLLLAGGTLGITYGAFKATSLGWLTPTVWPFWLSGTVLMSGYAYWARRQRHPLVNLELLLRNQGAIAMALIAIVSVVTFGAIILIPSYMQQIQARSAIAAGLALLPQGVITGVGTWIGMKLPAKWGMRATVLLGLALLAGSSWGLLIVSAATPFGLIAFILCGRSFAIGFVVQPLITTLIESLPDQWVADGNTLFNVVERISGTLGIALLVNLYQQGMLRGKNPLPASSLVVRRLNLLRHRQLVQAATTSFHHIVWVMVVLTLLGLTIALWTKNPESWHKRTT